MPDGPFRYQRLWQWPDVKKDGFLKLPLKEKTQAKVLRENALNVFRLKK